MTSWSSLLDQDMKTPNALGVCLLAGRCFLGVCERLGDWAMIVGRLNNKELACCSRVTSITWTLVV